VPGCEIERAMTGWPDGRFWHTGRSFVQTQQQVAFGTLLQNLQVKISIPDGSSGQIGPHLGSLFLAKSVVPVLAYIGCTDNSLAVTSWFRKNDRLGVLSPSR